MDLSRVNSYLDKHFNIALKQVAPSRNFRDGLTEQYGTYYFRPVGSESVFQLEGPTDSIRKNESALAEILGLLLDSWVKDAERADLLAALEVHLLHQMFSGDKVIPFRKRERLWNQRPPLPPEDRPNPNHLKTRRPWQSLLATASDALFIAQEIHRLLDHQFFLRITTPEEWIGYLEHKSAPLTKSTLLVELEKFPTKSFLIRESSKLLADRSFLIIQSTSAKRLVDLPHNGADFFVVSEDLKRQFTYKYLKDCARLCLGLQPLYRYGSRPLDSNFWLT